MIITGFADEIDQKLSVQIEELHKLGMFYIEMRGVDGDNLIFHSDEKVKEIKNILWKEGIRLSALGSPLGKIGIEDDFEKHFEQYKRAVEIAHTMECENIRMFSFYVPEDGGIEKYASKVFDQMGRMVDYAKANGVVLLHENEKGIYGEKALECKKLMDAFYGDHFKAIFDFANFVQAGENTMEAYALLKPYIAYLHVKDAKAVDGSVVPAGFGDGNVKVILDDLRAGGFHGFLSLEPHLFHFKGFESLEKDGVSIQNQKELSSVEAFVVAHAALQKILADE